MTDGHSGVWVVFNGEIYNHPSLARTLRSKGRTYRTRSDTESILNAYLEWGEGCFERLDGMFAIAIWDDRKSTLLLARDRLGMKPLLWANPQGSFLFASELKALLASRLVRRDVRASAIARFMHHLYVPAPEGPLKDVHSLEPGTVLKWRAGEISTRRYWTLSFRRGAPRSDGEWTAEFRNRLSDAVNSHLMSDVPVGAFLSGGLDSSAIVALLAEKSAPGSVLTNTIGFAEQGFDEAADAQVVASHLNTNHDVLVLSNHDFEDAIEAVLRQYDQPFADSSAVPTYLLCGATKRRVKVCLSGDGADELLAGYGRHKQYLLFELLRMVARPFSGTMRGLSSRLDTWSQELPLQTRVATQLAGFLSTISQARSDVDAYIYLRNIFRDGWYERIVSADFARAVAGIDPSEHIRKLASSSDAPDRLQRLLHVELLSYLPNDILQKVDMASMAFGLEVRIPFLDHHVVELVAGMPTHLKTNFTTTKVVLRRAMAASVPIHTMRKRKQGFHMPIASWFRAHGRPFLQDILLSKTSLGRGYFQQSAIERLVREHVTVGINHASKLWALLQLEIWHRNFIDSAPSLTEPDAISDSHPCG